MIFAAFLAFLSWASFMTFDLAGRPEWALWGIALFSGMTFGWCASAALRGDDR